MDYEYAVSLRRSLIAILALVLIVCLCFIAAVASHGIPGPERLPALFLIGDSTVNNSNKGQSGWGKPLVTHFDPMKIAVVNRARGGRSSRTYFTEGLWDKVLAEMQKGDYLLIQFGHNDGGDPAQGRNRASLDGIGDETVPVTVPATGQVEQVHTYGWYLRKYIQDAKAKGVEVIVLSPVPRNRWKEGKVIRAANDYGKWASEAAKSGGALFLDLNERVAVRYEAEGPQKVQERYFGTADHTHTTPAGAELNAEAIAEGIRALKECSLRDFLLPVVR